MLNKRRSNSYKFCLSFNSSNLRSVQIIQIIIIQKHSGNILIIKLGNLKRIYEFLPVCHLLQLVEADHWLEGIPYHHVGDFLGTFQLGQIYGLRIMIIYI